MNENEVTSADLQVFEKVVKFYSEKYLSSARDTKERKLCDQISDILNKYDMILKDTGDY